MSGGDQDRRRLALACADLGVFEFDATLGAMVLDRRARELLGTAAEGDLALADVLATIDPEDRERVAERLELGARVAGDPYHDEFRTLARRWISADGRSIAGGIDPRVVLVGVLSDVTLRRTTDDARARLVDEMARGLRFNEMLVGMVAHDVRIPLAALLAAPEPQRVASSAQRMVRIVDQLIDLTHARLDGRIRLDARDVDLADVARRVIAEVTAAEPAAAIVLETRGDPVGRADPDRMAQVFANLIGNAIRHGDDPGAVRVLIDGSERRTVSVTVSNPGAIPAEVTAILFNPFRRARGDRTAGDRHGLGLGLYIAQRIVLGHGGEIFVTSSGEAGTALRLELPRDGSPSSFSLTPDQGEEEAISLQRLGISDQQSRITASLFGVMPLQERAADAFRSLVERHGRLLALSIERQIYRDARPSLGTELREVAEQLGALGAGAGDVAALHAQSLQAALRGAPTLKAQALVTEGRLLALELMGRLLTYYRKRSGFGAARRSGGGEQGDD